MAFFRAIRKRGYNYRNVLVVGTGSRARQFMSLIKRRGEWGLKVVGVIDEDAAPACPEVDGHRVLGSLRDAEQILHEHVIDEVVFIIPHSWFGKIEEVIALCETEGIRVNVAVDVFDRKFAKARQTALEEFLLLQLDRTPIKTWQLFVKGAVDIALSGALLVLLSPVFVLVALATKATSKGPVLWRQTRCGLNGRKFTLYKFRTMVEHAESLLPELRARNEMKGPVFKMADDPRVTPLGRVLRKFSVDELPQLWNVFKRDMSIVGPRPPLPEEVKAYSSWQRRRLSMRPGITCLWQVQGRNRITDFDEWARLDLHYIDHWSIFADLRILAKTVPAVLFAIGAK
jgi:exopolysaccharide biosynthesis polyprenyl glycosylphosphotransferase